MMYYTPSITKQNSLGTVFAPPTVDSPSGASVYTQSTPTSSSRLQGNIAWAPSPYGTAGGTRISSNPLSSSGASATGGPDIGISTYSRPSVAELASVFKNQIGASPTITSTPTIDTVRNNLSTMHGLGQDFYDRQRAAMKDALKQEFFGPLGVLNQQASAESAAGRLGSGVGKTVLQESVAVPFAQGLTDIDRQVLDAQAQEAATLEQYKMDAINTAIMTDSKNAQEAQVASADLASRYEDLYSKLALGEAGLISQEQISQAQIELQSLTQAEQQKQSWSEQAVAIATTPVNAADYAEGYFNDLKASGVSADLAKNYYEMMADANPEQREAFDGAYKIAYGLT